MVDDLTPQQQAFCQEYLIDLNGTQSAIRAGYSSKSASQQGSTLLANPKVAKRLAELKQERCQETKIDSQYVLKRLHEISELDILDILNDDLTFKDLRHWPKAWRISLSAIDIAETQMGNDISQTLKKVKWPDKMRNIELLGKHVDVMAFQKDEVIVNAVSNIMTVPQADSAEDWESLAAQNQDGLLKRDS